MAIEAPLSSYKKKNFLIILLVLVGAAVIFGYDGYLSKYKWSMRHSFYQKHVIDNNGVPDTDMNFNRKSPPVFLAGAAVIAIYYFAVVAKKHLSADDSMLTVNGQTIAYDAIESINKTHFDKKGYFIVSYAENGQSKDLKINDRTYDNLPAVLDHIVAKIS
ncbi:MAG: hypothetical protein ACYSUT_01685 [Planctomycetota bacterium]|jgi:hypothetical protein